MTDEEVEASLAALSVSTPSSRETASAPASSSDAVRIVGALEAIAGELAGIRAVMAERAR